MDEEPIIIETVSRLIVARIMLFPVSSDELILQTPLQELYGFEFERLLALYFREQGFTVEETGEGGNDGGVDLALVDRRGERTAVQAKRYADHNKVPVQTIRELVGAKRNHNCVLTLIITTSDLTEPAKKEAEHFHVEYWNGGIVERKLESWGKYKPTKKKQRPIRNEVAATLEVICPCGSVMVIRKNTRHVILRLLSFSAMQAYKVNRVRIVEPVHPSFKIQYSIG